MNKYFLTHTIFLMIFQLILKFVNKLRSMPHQKVDLTLNKSLWEKHPKIFGNKLFRTQFPENNRWEAMLAVP